MGWRSAPMQRRTPLRARNPKRAKKRHAQNFGPQASLCRKLQCPVCVKLGEQQIGESVPHHDPTRAAGGTDRDTMPMCAIHHGDVHVCGRETFWTRVGLDPDKIIAEMRTKAGTT